MDEKVVVHFNHVQDAPRLKDSHRHVKVGRCQAFKDVATYLAKLTKKENLLLYLEGRFLPSLDEKVGTLFDSYATMGKLEVHYSLQPAWG